MSQYGSIRSGSPQPARRGFSIRTKIITLLLAPLVPLLVITVFAVAIANSPVRNLTNARTSVNTAGYPVASVVGQLENERALSVQHVSGPTGKPAATALAAARRATDTAVAALNTSTSSKLFQSAASGDTKSVLAKVRTALADLPNGRRAIDGGESRYAVMTYFNNTIDEVFRLYRAIATVDDHALAARAATVVAISQAGEAWSREDSLVIGVVTARTMTARDYGEIVGAIAVQRSMYASATSGLSATDLERYRQLTATPKARALRDMEDAIVAHPNAVGSPLKIDPNAWQSDFNETFQSIQVLDGQLAEATIRDMSDAASARATRVGLVAIACILMLIALVFFSWRVARNLLRRVTRLRAEALTLALDRLPSVVERIRTGRAVDIATEAPPLAADADELGQLSEAFTRVQHVAISAAVHEATLREGFNQVFLNIARRSQTLLHRQLALLDAMERRATDPEELEELFRVDHLATRMRRHAEDLVILAGSTPGRGWRNPVAVADVLRAAASEVEEYARINVIVPPDLSVTGHAVNDIVHLLAELLENATLFSPPESQVTLSAQVVPNGLAVEVEDRGLGMQPEAIEEANDRLATPPDFDPRNSSRLGLFVVAKLAERQGIQVTLRRSPYGGVTAVTLIPSDLVSAGTPLGAIDADVVSDNVIDAPPPPGKHVMALAGAPTPQPSRPRNRDDIPTGGRTADGLPIRVRQASVARTDTTEAMPPAPMAYPVEATASDDGLGSGSGGGLGGGSGGGLGGGRPVAGDAPRPAGPASTRSPEQMRGMLSSFQSGMARGRRAAASEFGEVEDGETPIEGASPSHPASTRPFERQPPERQPFAMQPPAAGPTMPSMAAPPATATEPSTPGPRATADDGLPPLPQRIGRRRAAGAEATAYEAAAHPAATYQSGAYQPATYQSATYQPGTYETIPYEAMPARDDATATHPADLDHQPSTSRGGGDDDN